ncbi:hypothetical protein Tco_1556768 [Tanacetum coccineum]
MEAADVENSHVRIVGQEVANRCDKEATEMATELMDKEKSTLFAERQAENKRKLTTSTKAQQQLSQRQNWSQSLRR